MVRTDSRERKLDAFIVPKSLQQDRLEQAPSAPISSSDNSPTSTVPSFPSANEQSEHISQTETVSKGQSSSIGQKRGHPNSDDDGEKDQNKSLCGGTPSVSQPFRRKRPRKEVKLTSVKNLQLKVRGQQHRG